MFLVTFVRKTAEQPRPCLMNNIFAHVGLLRLYDLNNSDQRRFGPSVMKTKQQQKLDNMIQKNAAIKDFTGSNLGSRYANKKYIHVCILSVKSFGLSVK